jgi:CO/xanthine dehydrogenase FAD-binding subunit
MKPAPFEYFAPTTVDEALELLARFGEDSRVLAGGQSLAALMNLRLTQPACLIDLNGVEELSWVRTQPDSVTVGAMARQRAVERSPEVNNLLPALVAALRHVGHFQIRNRGTIGGSICHADQAAELPGLLLACDGWVEARSAAGTRTIRAADLFVGPFSTNLRPDEIVTSVCFPVPPAGTGWSFQEVARRHGDFAVAGVTTFLGVTDGLVDRAAVVAIGVDSRPVRLEAAERVLMGHECSADLRDAAVEAGQAAVNPTGDLHASAETKRHLAGVLLRRTIDEAYGRATTNGGRQP